MNNLITDNIAIPFIFWSLTIIGIVATFILGQLTKLNFTFFKTGTPILFKAIHIIIWIVLTFAIILSGWATLKNGQRIYAGYKLSNAESQYSISLQNKLSSDTNKQKDMINNQQLYTPSYINKLIKSFESYKKSANKLIKTINDLKNSTDKSTIKDLKLFLLSIGSLLFYLALLFIFIIYMHRQKPMIIYKGRSATIIRELPNDRILIEFKAPINTRRIINYAEIEDGQITYVN